MKQHDLTTPAPAAQIPESFQRDVLQLWEQNRLRCAWHVRQDFQPHTRKEMLQCLQQLAKHGDRATYVSARRLIKCL